MTMRKVPVGGTWIPQPINFTNGLISFIDGLYLEDGGVTKVAFTFQCPVSGTLDMFEFGVDADNASPLTTLKVSFQDLDSNRVPDGTGDQYRVITLGDFDIYGGWIEPGIMTSDGTDTGVKRTVTRGQILAFVIEFDSVVGGDFVYIHGVRISGDGLRNSAAGGLLYDGAWSRMSLYAIGALRYEGDVYYSLPEVVPAFSFSPTHININSEPDEVGLVFSLQTPARIGGAAFCLSVTGTSGIPVDCVVYDPNNNVLETVSIKPYLDLLPTTNAYSYFVARFSQDIFVSANESYKVTVKPSTTGSVSLLEMYFGVGPTQTAFERQEQLYGYRDTGNNQHTWMHVERFDGEEFETSTLIPLISLLITGTDMDAGGATDDWTGDA